MLHNLVYINALLDQPVFIMCAHTFFYIFIQPLNYFPPLKNFAQYFN